MKKIILIVLPIIFASCNQTEQGTETISQKKSDTTINLITPLSTEPEISHIDSLLLNPFDLYKFKKKKGGSNSCDASKQPYYFKPNTAGIYYGFFLFAGCGCGYIGEKPSKDIFMPNGLEIVTYKPLGKYKNYFFDPTETLIEISARVNDNDLPELAFVGLDTAKIKKKLGEKFLRKDNFFIYTKDNNVLTFKISGKTVQWLKYNRLNFSLTRDNIPAEMLVSPQDSGY